MKYLRTFENFDLENSEMDEQEYLLNKRKMQNVDNCEECDVCCCSPCECPSDEENFDYEKNGTRYGKDYLQEPPQEITLEKKKAGKLPPWLQKGKSKDKEEVITKGKSKKDEPKGKGKDESKGKEEKVEGKGLTAKQKKLPPALQKSILARKK